MSKFGESGQIIFSQNVSKNYFSQVYGQKCGKNVINGVNLVKIGHFFVKMVKNGSFWHNLGGKMPSYVKTMGKWSNNFDPKGF